MNKYRVWSCKIIVPQDAELPEGFDGPPRCAAIEAVELEGIDILGCFSGWGGELNDVEKEVLEKRTK